MPDLDVDTQIKLTIGTQYVENLLLKEQVKQLAAELADVQKQIKSATDAPAGAVI